MYNDSSSSPFARDCLPEGERKDAIKNKDGKKKDGERKARDRMFKH